MIDRLFHQILLLPWEFIELVVFQTIIVFDSSFWTSDVIQTKMIMCGRKQQRWACLILICILNYLLGDVSASDRNMQLVGENNQSVFLGVLI